MQFFREKVFTLDEYERRLLEQIVLEGSRTFSDRLNDIYLMNMTKSENAIFGGEQMIKNLIEILLIALFRRNADRTGRFENTAEGIPERQDCIGYFVHPQKRALYPADPGRRRRKTLFLQNVFAENFPRTKGGDDQKILQSPENRRGEKTAFRRKDRNGDCGTSEPSAASTTSANALRMRRTSPPPNMRAPQSCRI